MPGESTVAISTIDAPRAELDMYGCESSAVILRPRSMRYNPRAAFVLGAASFLVSCVDSNSLVAPSAPASLVVDAVPQAEIVAAPLGRVIVRFRDNSAVGRATSEAARDGAAQAFAQKHGARRERAMRLPRAFVLQAEAGQETALLNTLSGDPDVEWAEFDELIPLQPCETGNCAETNDGFRGYKWDLHNTGSITNSLGVVLGATGAANADIDWLEMYDALGSAFSGSAVIGIVDSGILPTHVDLAGKVIAAQNFATGYPASQTQDRDSHGTHVAGIAAAAGNNGTGLMGVGYGANIKLINAKSCDLYLFPGNVVRTSCPTSSTADAIVWATDQGANVLNLSLGGSVSATSGSAAQQAAFQYALSKGVLPFCASGNDGSTTQITFPARFPECVAVASTNWSDLRASYSNASPKVALSAPGGDGASLPFGNSLVLSTIPSNTANNSLDNNNSYGWKAGTSMATPQAAGLAAVLFATGVGNADAVLARMQATSDDLGAPGADAFYGAGRINACRAIDPAVLRIALPGSIKLSVSSSAIVPLTLFGGPRFTVEQFTLANLTLQTRTGSGVTIALRDGEYRVSVADVDGDGVLDLSLKFSRDALNASGDLAAGERTFTLSGNVGCRRVAGTAGMRVRN
jgi:subtilisin family serine protease